MRLFKWINLSFFFITSIAFSEIACPQGCGRKNSKASHYILNCLEELKFVEESKSKLESLIDDNDEVIDYFIYIWRNEERYRPGLRNLSWQCEYDEFYNRYVFRSSDVSAYNPDFLETLELLEAIRIDIEYIHDVSNEHTLDNIKECRKELKRTDHYCNHEEWIRTWHGHINEHKEELKKFELEKNERMNIYAKFSSLVQASYLDIFNNCLVNHQWNGTYFSRGLLLFQQGDFFSSLEDISKYIKGIDNETLSEEILKAKFHQGTLQNILGKYTDAIETLSQVISSDPNNKNAYIERAIAFFEQGNFDRALNDYIKSEIKPTQIDESFHSLEFSGGIVLGLCTGAGHTLENFVPSMLCSLQGLGNGIWAFTTNPKEVSVEMITACKNICGFFTDQTILESLKVLIPEVRELSDWKDINDFKKGEIIGSIVGKYGLDIFLTAGAMKGIKVFHDLRRANALMTLETMTLMEKGQTLKSVSSQWKNKVSKELENIKTRPLASDKEIYKKYKGQVLNETQVRKILHEAGYDTFQRPKSIPENFKVSISEKNGGMKYTNPDNPHDFFRVMPGDPYSAHAVQQKPYVVRQKDGKYLNKKGKVVEKHSNDSHIPLDELEQ